MRSVLITGANRGIGLEFVRQYAGDGWSVHACCRNPKGANELNGVDGDIIVHVLDVTDFERVKSLADELKEPLDIVIANAGVLANNVGAFGSLDYAAWNDAIKINLMGAVSICEAFAPHVCKTRGKIAALSSMMGSISQLGVLDDPSGGAMGYRTSKTALNMAMKIIAGELVASGVAVGVFNPGWVRTDMGGPTARMSVEASVEGLRKLINGMPVTDQPKFLDHAGQEIPW